MEDNSILYERTSSFKERIIVHKFTKVTDIAEKRKLQLEESTEEHKKKYGKEYDNRDDFYLKSKIYPELQEHEEVIAMSEYCSRSYIKSLGEVYRSLLQSCNDMFSRAVSKEDTDKACMYESAIKLFGQKVCPAVMSTGLIDLGKDGAGVNKYIVQ